MNTDLYKHPKNKGLYHHKTPKGTNSKKAKLIASIDISKEEICCIYVEYIILTFCSQKDYPWF